MLAAVSLTLALLGLVPGCVSSVPVDDAAYAPSQSASPEHDYPGWKMLQQMGPMSTQLVGGSAAGEVREDVAYLAESPDGTMRLLLWYARSGSKNRIGDAAWVRLGELFIADSWDSPQARALYSQVALDNPGELLLGAYPSDEMTDPSSELWHVGFYIEQLQGGQPSWIRGDHLYEYNRTRGGWRLVEADSGSENAWNTTGPVKD